MEGIRLHPESVAVASGRPERRSHAPLNPPIVLSAPFHHGAGENPYVRDCGSETTRAFETAIGALEGGTALAYSSGMAAITAVLDGLPTGSVVVAPVSCYNGASLAFREQERLGRLVLRRVDVTATEEVVAALPGAALIWLESPTNPLMGIVETPVVTAAAHAGSTVVCLDSTFTTPLLFRPLEHGVDIVMHSATKYLAGHSDALLGVLVMASADDAKRLQDRRTVAGSMPGALESYLALRGLRTLAVRMERAEQNALQLANRLTNHPAVTRVRYPGLPSDPSYDRATRLQDGYGAMISFEVAGSAEEAERVCQRVRLITHATSLGGVETLIERRARYPIDAENGTPPTLLRLSVGIEHVEDLWADLAAALAAD